MNITIDDQKTEIITTNTIMGLTPETLSEIKKEVEIALLRRGFHVDVTVGQEIDRHGKRSTVTVTTSDFQTTPVVFKRWWISESSSWVTEVEDGNGILAIVFGLSARHESFSGGTNGTDLITFRCCVRSNRDTLYEVAVS